MKLSVKVGYACRVLAQLARRYGNGELAHIDELARAEGIPANYLVQILSELRNGGLIISRRGKQGGYALARAPDEVTLLEIVRLIEGELLEMSGGKKGQSGPRVQEVWGKIRKSLEAEIRAVTLDQLATSGAPEMYYI